MKAGRSKVHCKLCSKHTLCVQLTAFSSNTKAQTATSKTVMSCFDWSTCYIIPLIEKRCFFFFSLASGECLLTLSLEKAVFTVSFRCKQTPVLFRKKHHVFCIITLVLRGLSTRFKNWYIVCSLHFRLKLKRRLWVAASCYCVTLNWSRDFDTPVCLSTSKG